MASLIVTFLIALAANAKMIKAEVVGEYPYVYSAPSFDAVVMTTLNLGTFYNVSRQQFDLGFRRVQLPNNQVGYISSSEIRIVTAPVPGSSPKAQKKKNIAEKIGEEKEPPKKFKSIVLSRYRGLIVEQQNYTEGTMSKLRSEMLTFFGFRMVGFNTLFTGMTSTDTSVLFHLGAPKYYEKVTGNSANGWVLNAHFTFDTIIPMTHSFMSSYGFGPMFKYSHFQTGLRTTGSSNVSQYVLDDMTLGVLFRAGIAARWNIVSVRADIKYFIESQRYISMNLSTLFEF